MQVTVIWSIWRTQYYHQSCRDINPDLKALSGYIISVVFKFPPSGDRLVTSIYEWKQTPQACVRRPAKLDGRKKDKKIAGIRTPLSKNPNPDSRCPSVQPRPCSDPCVKIRFVYLYSSLSDRPPSWVLIQAINMCRYPYKYYITFFQPAPFFLSSLIFFIFQSAPNPSFLTQTPLPSS